MNAKLLTILILPWLFSACGAPADAPTGQTAPAAEHEPDGHAGDEHDGDEHAEDQHAEDEHEDGHVELTPAQIKAAGIELATVGPANIRDTLPLYGVIAPNAERVLDVAARFPGVLRSVRKQVGDAVQKGDALATVESNESLQTYAVVSPLTGVVTARAANTGEQTGERVLFTVADLDTVWVELALFPRDVARVRVGQGVTITAAGAELTSIGNVMYVAPIGSTASQTLSARVLLDNAERRWAPGLYVTADVTLAEASAPLAIHSEAVQTVEGNAAVFVRVDDRFEARPVRLGRTDGSFREVLEGLNAGEEYVTKNSFILKSELGKGDAEHAH